MQRRGLIERPVEVVQSAKEFPFPSADGRSLEPTTQREGEEAGDRENLDRQQPLTMQIEFAARAADAD